MTGAPGPLLGGAVAVVVAPADGAEDVPQAAVSKAMELSAAPAIARRVRRGNTVITAVLRGWRLREPGDS